MNITLAAVDVGASLQQGLDDFVAFLPNLIGFLAILLVGYIVAKVLQKVVSLALEKIGTDRAVAHGDTGQYIQDAIGNISPSRLIGQIVFWFVFLGSLSLAITALGIQALNEFISAVFNYLPNVIVAVLIFVAAVALAGALARLAQRLLGDSPLGRMLATAIPALVLGIAVFMILNQLKIASDIVTITYAAIMGSVALGAALAFGLGGRPIASRMLEQAYDRGQEQIDQARVQANQNQAAVGNAPNRAERRRQTAATRRDANLDQGARPDATPSQGGESWNEEGIPVETEPGGSVTSE